MFDETNDSQVGIEAIGAKAPIVQLTPRPSEVTTSNADLYAVASGDLTTLDTPVSAISGVSRVANSTLPIHIYPKAALKLLQLKCPTVRNYCAINASTSIDDELISGLNRTLSFFDGGREAAHSACSTASGFDQARFDADMAVGSLPVLSEYTCTQIRADGSSTCPTGGCPLPTGEITKAPLDLLTWACNTNEVGPAVLARSVVTSEFANNIIRVNDTLYVYHDGIYSGLSDITLSRIALPHLGHNAKPRHIAEVVKMLFIQCERSVDAIRPDPDFICLSNGTLNVVTRNLEPHSAEHMLLNRIPHAYSANAGCDGFIRFLNSIWAGDRDCEQKIQAIRQWIGYQLVSDSRMQKMLILNGQGANGKSVLMDLIRKIVGEENTSSAMLDRLRHSYVRATMEGKLLNISADLPKKGIVADGDLKALIGGDAIEVALKHKPSRTIKPYVRLMVATNNMPDCKDTSDGYFRRLMILTFNRQFAENERNPNLLQSLLPEIPGIIAWALAGLYELREQGGFSIPASSGQAVQLYREDMSPVRFFSEECLVASTDRSGFLPRDLFMAFRAWCRDRGLDAGNMITLGRELSALGFERRKSGKTWWLVKVKEEDAQHYFRPAQIVPGIPLSSPDPGLALAA